MKVYTLLLLSLCCVASDRSDRLPAITSGNVTNTITVTGQRHVQRPKYKDPERHPSVQEANKKAMIEQNNDDLATCCCFIKIKKPVR